MSVLLPSEFSIVALEKGWGVIHPLTDSISGENSVHIMIFGPRDGDELKNIWIISKISLLCAQPESGAQGFDGDHTNTLGPG